MADGRPGCGYIRLARLRAGYPGEDVSKASMLEDYQCRLARRLLTTRRHRHHASAESFQSLYICPVPSTFHSRGPLALRAATIDAAVLGLVNATSAVNV